MTTKREYREGQRVRVLKVCNTLPEYLQGQEATIVKVEKSVFPLTVKFDDKVDPLVWQIDEDEVEPAEVSHG